MACLQCLISLRQRRFMAFTLATLVALGWPVALGVMYVGVELWYLNSDYWAVRESHLVADYFPYIVLAIAAFSIVTSGFTIGVNLAAANWKTIFKNQQFFLIALFVQLLLQSVDFFLMLVLGLKFIIHEGTLAESFSKGFKDLMSDYHLIRDYKMLIDRIQFRYRCCGGSSYREWFVVGWFREEFITEDLNESMRFRFIEHGFLIAPVVPFSCCSVKSMRPCERWFLKEGSSSSGPGSEFTLNSVGCGQALTEGIAYSMFVLGRIVLWHSIVKVVILIISRYHQTSTQLAINFADPTQSSPGYLMSYGAPPVPPGAPVDAFDVVRRNEMLADLAKAGDEMDALVDLKLAEMDRYHLEHGYLDLQQ